MKWWGGVDKTTGKHRLAASELLCDLNRREIAIVEGFSHERHYLAGEVIFDAGEEGHALYLIVQGRVAICRPGEDGTPLAELGADAFFGEMGLLDNSPRSAQARAIQPSTLLVLPRSDYERLMAAHARIASRIALQLARHLGRRLRRNILAANPESAP